MQMIKGQNGGGDEEEGGDDAEISCKDGIKE